MFHIEIKLDRNVFLVIIFFCFSFAYKDLFQSIETEFEKIDIEKDRNDFFPHITLARIKYPQTHTPDIDLFLKSSYDPIDLSLDRVQFFSSELLPSGAIYTLLKTFPLGEQV